MSQARLNGASAPGESTRRCRHGCRGHTRFGKPDEQHFHNGKALNQVAADDVRIGVTGNPANTNALIAMSNAPDIPRERFSALTRLDQRGLVQALAPEMCRPPTGC